MAIIDKGFADTILDLANRLNKEDIPHTINTLWDGLQIRFPWTKGDVICHRGSINHKQYFVETMGFPWDKGDVSSLSVDEAFRSIHELYWELYRD
jgi:hypothetical protein